MYKYDKYVYITYYCVYLYQYVMIYVICARLYNSFIDDLIERSRLQSSGSNCQQSCHGWPCNAMATVRIRLGGSAVMLRSWGTSKKTRKSHVISLKLWFLFGWKNFSNYRFNAHITTRLFCRWPFFGGKPTSEMLSGNGSFSVNKVCQATHPWWNALDFLCYLVCCFERLKLKMILGDEKTPREWTSIWESDVK